MPLLEIGPLNCLKTQNCRNELLYKKNRYNKIQMFEVGYSIQKININSLFLLHLKNMCNPS